MTKNDMNYPFPQNLNQLLSDYDKSMHKLYPKISFWGKMKEKYEFTDSTPLSTMAKVMEYTDWVRLHQAVKYRSNKTEFKVSVTRTRVETYFVEAEDWEEAEELASMTSEKPSSVDERGPYYESESV
tara:strand:+ start:34753 stop:35133 length:381 start_codon:yes stop_codon:yes gene_type:complete